MSSINKKISATLLLSFFSLSSFAANPSVSFIEPKDGAVVEETFKVKMDIQGMKLCPANIQTDDKQCGHHHLLVDVPFVPEQQVIVVNERHIHFGKLQTETELKLSPGKHTLTLQFADFAHRSYGKSMSSTINIEVKPRKTP